MTAPALGWWTWAAMLAVLGAAAILSFAALRDLAVLCGVEPALAWLLPVCVDAGAAVSTRVWLDGRAVHAERYARAMTWAMLAVTVAGNALHGGLVAAGMAPTWWTAVAVSAVPPVVVGATVHLAVLVGKQAATGRPEMAVAASADAAQGAGTIRTLPGKGSETVRALSGGSTGKGAQIVGPAAAVEGDSVAGTPAPGSNQVQPGPTDGQVAARDNLDGVGKVEGGDAPDRAAELISEGAGRRRLARELGITEHAARELLDGRRNGVAR